MNYLIRKIIKAAVIVALMVSGVEVNAQDIKNINEEFYKCDELGKSESIQECYDKVNDKLEKIKDYENQIKEKELQKCSSKNNQMEMNECYGKILKNSEKELNKIYSELEKKVENKSLLSKTKATWFKYRKAQCEFETAGFVTGSIYPTIFAMCLNRLTQQQIDYLKHQLYCMEGDITCGGQ